MVAHAERVLALLALVTGAGMAVWLDGGWGVGALLGGQHREQEDVDLVA